MFAMTIRGVAQQYRHAELDTLLHENLSENANAANTVLVPKPSAVTQVVPAVSDVTWIRSEVLVAISALSHYR